MAINFMVFCILQQKKACWHVIYGSQFHRYCSPHSTGQTNYNTLPTGNCSYQFERIFSHSQLYALSSHVHCEYICCNYSFGLQLSFSFSLSHSNPISFYCLRDIIDAIDASVHSHKHISHWWFLFMRVFNESNLQAVKWYFSLTRLTLK